MMEGEGLATMTSLDDVIQAVGQCGPFQALLVLCVHATVVACVAGMMMMAFGRFNPGWHCLDLESADSHENLSDFTNHGGDVKSTQSNLSRLDNTTDQCTLFRTCKNVSFHPGSSTIATEWGLVCDKTWALDVILTLQMVGVFLGSYLVGYLGDRIGRQKSLYVMVGLHAVFNFLAVFSPSWEIFAIIRFFIGVCTGGIFNTAYVIPLEFAGQLWRGVIAALPTWNIGASIFSFFVILSKDWRHLHLLYAGLSCLVLVPVFWVPESIRWLAVWGREKQAIDVVNRIARLNGRPLLNLEAMKMMAENERQKVVAERTQRYTYIDLFKVKMIRRQTLVMGFVRMTMSIAYFAISFNVQALSGNFFINFVILSMMEIPTIILSMPTNSFLTRRVGACLHLSIVTIMCLGITILSLTLDPKSSHENTYKDSKVKANCILVLAVIAKLGVLCTWNVSTVYSAELFPTVVRNMAFGYLNALARVGSLLGSVFFPKDPALLYMGMIVLSILTTISLGLIWLLPETKRAPLKDMFSAKASLDRDHLPCLNDHVNIKDGSKKGAKECFQSADGFQINTCST